MAFPDPGAKHVALGDALGHVRVWSRYAAAVTGKVELGAPVARVEWTGDGSAIVVALQGQGELAVLAPNGRSVVRRIATGHGAVLGLAVHPSRPYAATTGTDGSVRVWEVRTGRRLLEVATGPERSAGLAVALSARLVAAAAGDDLVAWELADGREHGRIAPFYGPALRVEMAFAPAGERLLAASGSELVAIDTFRWQRDVAAAGSRPRIQAIDAGREGRFVCAYDDDTAAVYDAVSDPSPRILGASIWERRQTMGRLDLQTSCARLLPGTGVIATTHLGGELRFWPASGADTARPRATWAFDDADVVVEGLPTEPFRSDLTARRERGEWDAAWCAAESLVLVGAGDEDERAFHERFVRCEARPVTQPLDAPLLEALWHEDEAALYFVADVFAMLATLAPDRDFGGGRVKLDWRGNDAVKLAYERTWAARLLGLRQDRPASFAREPPTLDQERLWLAARSVVYERPPIGWLYARGPTRAEIVELFTATLTDPPPDADPVVIDAARQGVAEIPDAATRWIEAVHASANRAGLVVAGSLASFERVLEEDRRVFGEDSGWSANDAVRTLASFAASEVHVELRRHLGRHIDAPRARTAEEVGFYATIEPCARCGAVFDVDGVSVAAAIAVAEATCAGCGIRRSRVFFAEPEAPTTSPRPGELGPDDRPSAVVTRALLDAEHARCLAAIAPDPAALEPAAWRSSARALERVVTCCLELAKYLPSSTHLKASAAKFQLDARAYAATAPLVIEREGNRPSLRDEIDALLALVTEARLPTGAEVRAAFAQRRMRELVGGGDPPVTVIVLEASDVTSLRIWDDARGTHALLAVGRGTLDDVGESERLVEGHPVRLGAITLADGSLVRVSIDFPLAEAAPTAIGPILDRLFSASGPPATVGALVDALGVRLDRAILPAAGMGALVLALPALGAGGAVTFLSVTYLWSLHHDEPIATVEELRARRPWDWNAAFGEGAGEVEAAFRRRFPRPRPIDGGLVAGSFVFWRRDGTLSWHAHLPDALLPAPDPARRREALSAVLVALAEGREPGPGAIPTGTGIEARLAGGERALVFAPALPANELVALLGMEIASAVGQTFTVHQDSWEIRVVVGRGPHGPVTEPLRLGGLWLRARLADRPTGGSLTAPNEPAGPPGGTHRLGPADSVRVLEIARAAG